VKLLKTAELEFPLEEKKLKISLKCESFDMEKTMT